jgi:hypothetical protein
MTKNEQRLFDIINEDDNPQEALIIAINTICDFLDELGASQDKHPAYLQEFV